MDEKFPWAGLVLWLLGSRSTACCSCPRRPRHGLVDPEGADPVQHSGYERTVWELDAREQGRAEALLSASASGRK